MKIVPPPPPPWVRLLFLKVKVKLTCFNLLFLSGEGAPSSDPPLSCTICYIAKVTKPNHCNINNQLRKIEYQDTLFSETWNSTQTTTLWLHDNINIHQTAQIFKKNRVPPPPPPPPLTGAKQLKDIYSSFFIKCQTDFFSCSNKVHTCTNSRYENKLIIIKMGIIVFILKVVCNMWPKTTNYNRSHWARTHANKSNCEK